MCICLHFWAYTPNETERERDTSPVVNLLKRAVINVCGILKQLAPRLASLIVKKRKSEKFGFAEGKIKTSVSLVCILNLL